MERQWLTMERQWLTMKTMTDYWKTIDHNQRLWLIIKGLWKDNDDYLQIGSLDDYEDNCLENGWWLSN